MKSSFIAIFFSFCSVTTIFGSELEFGRPTSSSSSLRANTSMSRKRRTSHGALLSANPKFDESDRWLEEFVAWSELSTSYSFSFSYAGSLHHPTISKSPTTKAPAPTPKTTTTPTSAPTSNAIVPFSLNSDCSPSTTTTSTATSESPHCLQPLSYPSSHHPSHDYTAPSLLPLPSNRPSTKPELVTTFAPTFGGLVPIGLSKTSKPTKSWDSPRTNFPTFDVTLSPKPSLQPSFYFSPTAAVHSSFPSPPLAPSPMPHDPPHSAASISPSPPISSSISYGNVASTAIFGCLNGIPTVIANSSDNATAASSNETTTVEIAVTYSAESWNGTNFLTKLPGALLQTAVNASLNCQGSAGGNSDGNASGYRQLGATVFRAMSKHRQLAISTEILGQCTAKVKRNADCFLLQTTLKYILNKNLDTDYAAFVAYVAIQNSMEQGIYVAQDPLLVELKYVSPTPTFSGEPFQPLSPSSTLPPSSSSSSSSAASSASSSRDGVSSSISGWTAGACIVVSVGGFIALMVWTRNRWTRHRRHILLVDEEISVSSPSGNIPSDDHVDDK